ncbi:MAG: hypothetical protein ACYDDE_00465 [bacterium]
MIEQKKIDSLIVIEEKVLNNLNFKVSEQKDLMVAKNNLKKIGAIKKVITNFFENPIKTLFESYKTIRDTRNNIINNIEEKESLLKQEVIKYLDDNEIQDGEFIRTQGVDYEINMHDFIEGVKNGDVPDNLIAVNESALKKEIKTMGDLLEVPGITIFTKKFIRLKNEHFDKLAN